MKSPCEHCPWRLSNHGKRTPWGFYTKANLTRLWNQIRRGGKGQSCHPTDPSHKDHIEAGAKPGANPQECAGAIILVRREFAAAADETGKINDETLARYKRDRKDGLTRSGLIYWLLSRLQLGGTPFGQDKLPEVNDDEPGVARIGREAEA